MMEKKLSSSLRIFLSELSAETRFHAQGEIVQEPLIRFPKLCWVLKYMIWWMFLNPGLPEDLGSGSVACDIGVSNRPGLFLYGAPKPILTGSWADISCESVRFMGLSSCFSLGSYP